MYFLNQIFYPYNKFDEANKIKLLNKYMLMKPLAEKILYDYNSKSVSVQVPEILPIPEIPIKPTLPIKPQLASPVVIKPHCSKEHHSKKQPELQKSIVYPQKVNSLFWCLFISEHGYDEYQMIVKNHISRELEEKQKMIDFIKKTPHVLKECNIKVTNVMIQEILSDLMLDKKSNIMLLLAMMVYYKKHVYLYKDHMYYKLTYNAEEPTLETTILIHYTKDNQYGIDLEITQQKIDELDNNRIKLDHFQKPIKGVSTYKMDELHEIADKLGINGYEKWKKSELYSKIIETCVW